MSKRGPDYPRDSMPEWARNAHNRDQRVRNYGLNRRRRNNGREFSDKDAFGIGFVGGILLDGAMNQALDSMPNIVGEAGVVLGVAILGGVGGVVINRLFGPRI